MDSLTRLALAARDGNKWALSSFIHQTQGDVWRLCRRLGPAGSAEDLTQDVFMRAIKALPNFRSESSAKTWLFAIARNTATDALRSQVRRERLMSRMRSRSTQSEFDPSIDIRDLIESLQTDQREAFVLTQLVGLSYEEAAKVCKCPVGTIRSRVARSRTQLIEMIDLSDRTSDHLPKQGNF